MQLCGHLICSHKSQGGNEHFYCVKRGQTAIHLERPVPGDLNNRVLEPAWKAALRDQSRASAKDQIQLITAVQSLGVSACHTRNDIPGLTVFSHRPRKRDGSPVPGGKMLLALDSCRHEQLLCIALPARTIRCNRILLTCPMIVRIQR